MQLSDQELETLIKIENIIGIKEKKLFGRKFNKVIRSKWYDEVIEITDEDFIDFVVLLEKIIEGRN